MKDLYQDMMEVEAELPDTETVIARKVTSRYQKFYLYLNRIDNELNFGIELDGDIPSNAKIPNCKGVNVKWSTLPFTDGSKPALIISCVGLQYTDLFLRVASDLFNCLQNISDEKRMVKNAISRISMWQEFFKKYGDNAFSPERQKGLYGELRTLESICEFIPPEEVIKGWMGPYKESQDFHLKHCHFETKVTSRKEPGMIRIHGADQLTPPTRKDLYLHTITIKTTENCGETVVDIENRISAKLITRPELLEQFHTKLLEYGYPFGGFENPLSLKVEEESFYCVADDFPRYKRKEKTYNLEYDLLLSDIESFKKDISTIEEVLKKLDEAV